MVTLTSIYIKLHPYQTLVREIATPTVPAFATACVQFLKSSATESSAATLGLVETICDSLSSLVPLYPATLRPFSHQTLAAIKPLLAPTSSDDFYIPDSLQRAARQLIIVQHFVAAKSGGTDEWTKHIDDIINEIHYTADQIFRAIVEPSDSSDGRSRPQVIIDMEPRGGPPSSQYPPWSGIQAGSQRLIGLFHYLSDCLLYSTKDAVLIPLEKINGVIARICLIARQSPRSQTWEQALQTQAAIGREEKEELWSVLPDIHVAVLSLVRVAFERLADDMVSVSPELLDHTVRVFNSGISLPTVRSATYETLKSILLVVGPTLNKSYTDALGNVIGACCRDLQEDAGYLKQAPKTASSAETKKNGATTNADLFLKKADSSLDAPTTYLEQQHRDAASTLLALLLSHVPQKHLKPSLRGLLDQTAILTQTRDAMVSSVLNPFTDPRGRRYPSILPQLTQIFPNDQALEVLRTNLRTDVSIRPEEDEISVEDLEDEDEDVNMDDGPSEQINAEIAKAATNETVAPLPITDTISTELPIQNNPFESKVSGNATTRSGFEDIENRAASPPKRKHEEESEPVAKKRQVENTSKAPETVYANARPVDQSVQDDEDDDSDDESVHLNMVLEDDEDDEEDDE